MAFDAEKLLASDGVPALERGARAKGAPWLGSALAALGAGALVVAYRGLIGFDPAAGPTHDLRGVEGMLFEPSGSSPLLVFASVGWLFARRAARIRATLGAPGRPFAAAAALGVATALAGWATYVQEPTLLLPSLSLAILGAALALGGMPALRAVLLPALFLLFAVPIPPVLLNRFMYSLQIATAASTAQILQLFGFDAVVQGDRIHHADKIFQVIESCSGVRTIGTLFMSSFLYHDLFYRSRLQSSLIVASSIVIGLLVNQVRVITIVLNPYSHFAAVHATQGLVMIVVGVLLLAAVDWLLSHVLPARPWWRRPGARFALPRTRLAAVVTWALALAVLTGSLRPWQPQGGDPPPLSSLPAQLDGWQVAGGSKLDREFLGSVSFSEWVHRRYEREGAAVGVLLGSNLRLDGRVDFGSPKVAIPGSGWQVVEQGPVRLDSGREVERFRVTGPGWDEQIVYLWTYGVESPVEEMVRSVLALDRGPWRRPGEAVLVRLAVETGGSPAAAEASLRRLAPSIERELARRLPSPSA